MEYVDITIEFLDGSTEKVEYVTRSFVAEGVLHLFKRNGTIADEDHLGSYPISGIKKWRRKQR